QSWQAVAQALSTIEDQLTRALLWNTARDMVRDAELPPGDFLTLAAAHLPAEPVVAIVEAVLSFARREIVDRSLPLARHAAALATLTGICREIMHRSEDGAPGSAAAGMFLAAVRGLIHCATTTDDLAELQEWLRSGQVRDGRRADPELRWMALL